MTTISQVAQDTDGTYGAVGLPPVPRRNSLSAEASGQEGREIGRDEAAGHRGEARLLRPGEWRAVRAF